MPIDNKEENKSRGVRLNTDSENDRIRERGYPVLKLRLVRAMASPSMRDDTIEHCVPEKRATLMRPVARGSEIDTNLSDGDVIKASRSSAGELRSTNAKLRIGLESLRHGGSCA